MTIKVDLLPTERKRFTFDPMMGFLLVIIILCTVGFVIYGAQLQKGIEDQKAEVAKVEAKIKDIENSLPQIDDLRADIAKIKGEIKVVESLKYDPVRYGNLLTEVGKVLPENVWLNSMAIEPGTTSITFTGTAAQMGGKQPLATVALLMENFQGSKMFTEATLSSTSQSQVAGAGTNAFTFQIETKYNADIAAGLAESAPVPAEAGAEEAPAAAEAAPKAGASPEASPAAGESPSPGATPGT